MASRKREEQGGPPDWGGGSCLDPAARCRLIPDASPYVLGGRNQPQYHTSTRQSIIRSNICATCNNLHEMIHFQQIETHRSTSSNAATLVHSPHQPQPRHIPSPPSRLSEAPTTPASAIRMRAVLLSRLWRLSQQTLLASLVSAMRMPSRFAPHPAGPKQYLPGNGSLGMRRLSPSFQMLLVDRALPARMSLPNQPLPAGRARTTKWRMRQTP
ncbi:hypothetical protein BDP55DRAFT_412962 [Colletotrichum godetiae]|uniref:Uncharacterized protein n=1 Tax=Colletotrichum godetiae TaxID=1209918 RepID=A0AAJ0AWX5_9PEZI|nr:uncharacterized protein BDP55DRAFT_412962 [Colletotrichum godetiae]KAK1689644.1 hypothetical protein BDP55DRAFT_412962 [Colletotrichum godetiae]